MRILADPYERETGVAKLALLRVLCFHVFLDIDALARFCLEREGYSVVLRETLNLAVTVTDISIGVFEISRDSQLDFRVTDCHRDN